MKKFLSSRYYRMLGLVAVALSVSVAFVSDAMATESEGATKIKEVATSVGTEGVTIILAVLGALVSLIAISIILPKAVRWIKRFV